MTYRRQIGSVEAAVLEALHDLSRDEVERATGVSLEAIQDAGNPHTRKQLSLKHAAALDAALTAKGRPEIFGPLFERMRDRRLREIGGGLDHEPGDPRDRLVDIQAEVGEIAEAIRAARADGQYSADEIAEMAKQTTDVKNACGVLLTDLEAMATDVKGRRPQLVSQ